MAEDEVDSMESLDTYKEKYMKPFLEWSEKHCFVAEEETMTGRVVRDPEIRLFFYVFTPMKNIVGFNWPNLGKLNPTPLSTFLEAAE